MDDDSGSGAGLAPMIEARLEILGREGAVHAVTESDSGKIVSVNEGKVGEAKDIADKDVD